MAVEKDVAEQLKQLQAQIAQLSKAVADLTRLTAPFGVHLGDGTVLVQTTHGLRFYAYADDQIMTPKLIGNRIWEPSVTRHLLGSLKRDRVFVDVGANIGYFTCLAGFALGSEGGGRVIAIEPNPRALALLRRNVAINWSMAPISVHECAATARECAASLQAPRRLIANASLVHTDETSSDDVIDCVMTRGVPLSELVPPGTHVGTIKIDVEGGEYEVLLGAQELLERCPDVEIVMEWSTHQLSRAQGGADAVLKFLSERGFSASVIGKTLEPIGWDALASLRYANLSLTRT